MINDVYIYIYIYIYTSSAAAARTPRGHHRSRTVETLEARRIVNLTTNFGTLIIRLSSANTSHTAKRNQIRSSAAAARTPRGHTYCLHVDSMTCSPTTISIKH